jgi:predicted house-cleaning noncanonical NTP pyrophosphatase (MazG superfamily)
MIHTYNKLVRDKIPKIIERDGKKPKTRVLSRDEYELELKKKLIEEATEVSQTTTPDDLANEIADLMEVIDALLNLGQVSISTVLSKQAIKRDERGSFIQRIYLTEVDDQHG